MKTLKKLAAVISIAAVSAGALANQTVTIGASATPHAVILEHIKPELAKQGIDLKNQSVFRLCAAEYAVSIKKTRCQLFPIPPIFK